MTNDLTKMIGKVPTEITQDEVSIRFTFEDGTACSFYHEQDCCETVWIEDVNGDWEDLIGTPLLVSDEREGDLPPAEGVEWSYTWTFYTFRSIKGSVDVRWFGTSNGYYSEEVTMEWDND